MDVLADLGAGADRRPAIDHRALVHIGAEVDERGHQDDALGDESGMANDRTRHGAEAGSAELVFAPALEFRWHLVPPGGIAVAAGDHFHVVEPEGQKHRLFQPLVHSPAAIRAA